MKNSLFNPTISRQKLNFNPEGFDLAAAIKATEAREAAKANEPEEETVSLPKSKLSYSHLDAFSDFQPVELVDPTAKAETELVIRAAYRQVFGNAHLMESERAIEAESQLSSGQITVMEFIRQLAKSQRYQTLFFDRCSNLRAIELNFKHLLGRAPENQSEIAQHISILAAGGFEAEIDSYLDSDEYVQSFGTTIVPYYRGYKTQPGKNIAGFTHSFQLLRGASSSDKSIVKHSSSQLQEGLLEDKFTEINPLSTLPAPKPEKDEKSAKDETFKDLEIRNIGISYVASESSETSISPKTWLQQYQARQAAATFPAARQSQPVKLYSGASGEEIEIVIRAAYKQVFGNVHLMESKRSLTAESKLKDRQITIKDFIRELAKSDAYRSLFFDSCSNIRAIELNFKHLLGRAPDNGKELSEHSAILLEGGFEAEIDSYLDSPEYEENFGQDTVPYYVSYQTQTGKNLAGYNRIFELVKGSCSSDRTIGLSIASTQKSQLQKSLLKKPLIKKPIPFNPQGYDLAKRINVGTYAGRTLQESLELYQVSDPYKSVSDPYLNAFADGQPIELVPGDSVEQQDLVIKAAYKQVFGNAHLMESERSPKIESQLRSGEITVMEFVRQLAKSERYQALFFDNCTNLKAIELNFKHLLGRPPENSAEVSQHIKLLAEQGFAAEIDSYLDSDEYTQSFGTTIVPYYRGYKTQTGKNLQGFTNSFLLLCGASSSDKSTTRNIATDLDQYLLGDRSNTIMPISVTSDIPSQNVNSGLTSFSAAQYQARTYISPNFVSRVLTNSDRSITWQNQYNVLANADLIKFVPGGSEEELELVIRALYKQVLGNAHIMESERLDSAESKLKQGSITVREFVRELAKSDLYKSRFIENSPRYRSHELNFKHLLGRAPDSYQETTLHSNILDSQGYDADIDSYIDSEEYQTAYGEDIVPYYRGYKTQTGKSLLGYINMFDMLESVSTSDQAGLNGNKSRLQLQLMFNNASANQPAISSQPVTANQPILPNQPVTDTVDLIQKVLGIS